ncbi:UDP-glucuronosyl and UDP-glucosyl transferase [Handroanthus impetiginosus]|uniref:UDP-glucuronosyl and UDP-glucosyl transferase n=1 Tax=Handroanthus impetiginosus TaxID=429701 RepID=A0A2G9FY92_9LAMI|nr:UDP-glucuronosyl and UDP-glucosyl transferase [Handroanthus impetiginosus]
MGKPHVLAIPCPAQGHVIPMMELSQCLAKNGIKVTFVNTEFNHERVVKAILDTEKINELISLVSVPDGLESAEDRKDPGKLTEAMRKVMPLKLEALIEEINGTPGDGITCVLTDFFMAGALEVAEKFCVKRAAFLTAAVTLMALTINADKLIDDGIIDEDGTFLKNEMIQLSPSMPKMSTTHFGWTCFPDPTLRKIIFHSLFQNNTSAKLAQHIICNSSNELEPWAHTFIPNCFQIGPLLASRRLGKSTGYFWPEDSTCLDWLNQQPENSVIYIAFGSFTIFDQIQFRELALGLELTNKPFLWVVREDIIQDIDGAYPEGFKERVKNKGKIVNWAPQQEILSHPSIACFLSHCGWNSTIECVSNGIPLLCWPHFGDQFLNQSYVVDHWKIGLGFEKDEKGIIGREEIKNKMEKVLGDGKYKMRAKELQEKIIDGVEEGGRSRKNFENFIDWIKEN